MAVCAHLAVLTGLGWRIPLFGAPPRVENAPAVEVELIRPLSRSAAPKRSASLPRTRPQTPPPGQAIGPVAPTQEAANLPSASTASGGEGAADCEPEDLPLLTDAERQHCRTQIDAEKGRRMARTADARLAQRLAALSTAPHVDNIPAEKRAYYDAVAAAYDQQAHGPPMAGHLPGIGCSTGKAPPNSLKLGPCFISPPQGFLTEESGIPKPY